MNSPIHSLTPQDITLETVNQLGKPHFAGHIGMEFLSIDPNRLQSKLTVQKHLMTPHGYLHAATVVGLADSTCAAGCVINYLNQGAKGFTTIELKSNFLGTAQEGTVLCEAVPIHLGKTTHVWDATVSDEKSGKTIALFRCTQMILW